MGTSVVYLLFVCACVSVCVCVCVCVWGGGGGGGGGASQYIDSLSMYGDFHYKDNKTSMTVLSLHWQDGVLFFIETGF